MESKGRHYILGYFDALPRNVIGWNKIHQSILMKEKPEICLHFKYLSKNDFSSALVV